MPASNMLSASPTTHGHSTPIDLSKQEVFEILRNTRRRYTIHALKRAEEPLTIKDLSTLIAAWEEEIPLEDVDYDCRRSVHTTLQRSHLPLLESKGVVEIDEEKSLVKPTPLLEEIDVYVEIIRGREIPWAYYYLGLSVLIGAIVLAYAVDVPWFESLSPYSIFAFISVSFAVSAIIHQIVGRRMRLGGLEEPPMLNQ